MNPIVCKECGTVYVATKCPVCALMDTVFELMKMVAVTYNDILEQEMSDLEIPEGVTFQ